MKLPPWLPDEAKDFVVTCVATTVLVALILLCFRVVSDFVPPHRAMLLCLTALAYPLVVLTIGRWGIDRWLIPTRILIARLMFDAPHKGWEVRQLVRGAHISRWQVKAALRALRKANVVDVVPGGGDGGVIWILTRGAAAQWQRILREAEGRHA